MDSESPIADLDIDEAHKFLDFLRNDPFVAIIVSDGRVRIYKKDDMTPEHLSTIIAALADLIEGD